MDLIFAPVIAAFAGLIVWFAQSRIDAFRREQDRLHDDRRKIYAEFLDPFIRAFASIKNPREEKKALQQIQSIEYKRTAFEFNLIATDTVVRAHNNLMQYLYATGHGVDQTQDPARLMPA